MMRHFARARDIARGTRHFYDILHLVLTLRQTTPAAFCAFSFSVTTLFASAAIAPFSFLFRASHAFTPLHTYTP